MKKTAYFLLLCVAGVLFSCSEDDAAKTNDHRGHDVIEKRMNKVSFQEMKNFLKEHSKEFLPKSVDTSLNKNDSTYITKIDSTHIVQITYGGITSFTLYVETLDKENYAYSNLVLKYYKGELEEYVFHYAPTAEWQAAYDRGEKLPYDGELTITDVYGEEVERMMGSGCMIEVRIACYGDSCPCTDGEGQTFYISVPCGGGGGGEGGGTTPTNPTPGGFDPADGGGGGSNGSQFEQGMNDWFGEGNWSYILNPPNNLLSFNNFYDAYELVYGDTTQGSEGELINIFDQDSNNTRTTRYKLKFWNNLFGERGLIIYIKQTRDNNIAPNILNISTYWYGGTFFNTWTQHEYEVEDGGSCADCKFIKIWGKLRTSLIINEIPIAVENLYEIHLLIKKDGTILQPVNWWQIDD